LPADVIVIVRSLLKLSVAVLIVIAGGVAAVAASGAGSLAAPSHSHPALSGRGTPTREAEGLCGNVGAVDGGTVHRVGVLPADHLEFSFPAREHLRSAAAARHLAAVICALPKVRPGTYFCPRDLGVAYTIVLRGPSTTARLSARPWGCEWVTGAIHSRWTDAAFWRALGEAIGLHQATRDTFAGTLPAA